jgi:hypothetical protein
MAVGGGDVGKPMGPTAPIQLEQALRVHRPRVNEQSSAQQYLHRAELLGRRVPRGQTRDSRAVGMVQVRVRIQGRIRAQAQM